MRFQWYGLYHDKPKIGSFMMRVKIPSGDPDAGAAPHHRRALASASAATRAS